VKSREEDSTVSAIYHQRYPQILAEYVFAIRGGARRPTTILDRPRKCCSARVVRLSALSVLGVQQKPGATPSTSI